MSKRVWNKLTMVATLAGAIALGACASDDWETKYENQSKYNLDLAAENDRLTQERASEAAKVDEMGRKLKLTDAEKAKLAQEAEDLRATKAGGTPGSTAGPLDQNALSAIVEQMKRDLGKQAPEVNITKEGNIDVVLQSDVTFGSGSSELSDAGKKSIATLKPLLTGRFAPYQVRIEGHTDATPLVRTKEKYKDNFGLGSARSLSVVRYMESDLGIEPMRLMSASRGEHDPIADEKTSSGRRKNRRVDVVVVIPHDAAMSLAK